jgi:hypothetical protein
VSVLTVTDGPIEHWYLKLSPLFEHLWDKFKVYCILLSNVSVDEMIKAFTRQLAYTVKIINKLIIKSYKI